MSVFFVSFITTSRCEASSVFENTIATYAIVLLLNDVSLFADLDEEILINDKNI